METTNVYRQAIDDYIVGEPPGRPRQWVELSTRCRTCESCLKLRRLEWTDRMVRELAAAPRSWFGTLTLTPLRHDECKWRAVQRLAKAGDDWDRVSEGERFRERVRVLNKWLTDYVKRLRKAAKGSLRLCAVIEKHASGLPHVHMLVHEVELYATSSRSLSLKWEHGHTKWRVVNLHATAARYVAKYLSKSPEARLRASQGYGDAGTMMHRAIREAAKPSVNPTLFSQGPEVDRDKSEASDHPGGEPHEIMRRLPGTEQVPHER